MYARPGSCSLKKHALVGDKVQVFVQTCSSVIKEENNTVTCK